ncbi:uncharacterized protein G2W53_003858 [Senna tora]|uniref:Uncharacterized protein n=1 Tax=Senna tora TaxID=362788 RepID=A0A835CIT2_9FABA|nr:uncharacterized protein G2W53_003858 [Senna tora]
MVASGGSGSDFSMDASECVCLWMEGKRKKLKWGGLRERRKCEKEE